MGVKNLEDSISNDVLFSSKLEESSSVESCLNVISEVDTSKLEDSSLDFPFIDDISAQKWIHCLSDIFCDGNVDFVPELGTDILSASGIFSTGYSSAAICHRSMLVDTDELIFPSAGDWSISEYCRVHTAIRDSKLPNARGVKIPIPTSLNIDYLEHNLVDYFDSEVIGFMKYGWPLSVSHYDFTPSVSFNHKSAVDYSGHIDKWLDKAFGKFSVLGPFHDNPFDSPCMVSPLASVPKSEEGERRTILNCSCPKRKSVNDLIIKQSYLGEPFYLTFPGVDDLVELIKLKGKGCLIFKRDLSAAYRQLLRVDPGDIPLVAFKWKGFYYFDLTMPMGVRSACLCCQRTSLSLLHIFKKQSKENAGVVYLDDLAGADTPERAFIADEQLGDVLSKSGVIENLSKHCPPSTLMTFLGVLFDTVNSELRVTDERLAELSSLLLNWSNKVVSSKKELQSLIGKLNFVAGCVKPGRVFLGRMYGAMKVCPDVGYHALSKDFKLDLGWWRKFLHSYNGVSMMSLEEWSSPDLYFTSDSNLTGFGGWNPVSKEYFKGLFPEFVLSSTEHINQLELVTILLACKSWGKFWAGKKILARCDNSSSCDVLNAGYVRDDFMMACLRELALTCANYQFEIRALHLPGKINQISDVLSRFYTESHARSILPSVIDLPNSKELIVPDEFFKFSSNW